MLSANYFSKTYIVCYRKMTPPPPPQKKKKKKNAISFPGKTPLKLENPPHQNE